MSEIRERLLDLAEGKLRADGFHPVSFRELAKETGIKSASVHYHFPKKADLGTAVVERYGTRFFATLDTRVAQGEAKLPAYIAVFREALTGTDKVCLCGIMGAETLGLPERVRKTVRDFLVRNVRWLEAAYKEVGIDRPQEQALHTVAALQGAMMLSVNFGKPAAFDAIAREVIGAVRARAQAG